MPASAINIDLQALLASGYSLPPLSPIAVRLIDLAATESATADQLAQIIEQDPALAIRLLQLANSAFYQIQVPASTIQQAIVRIGFHRLRMMALTISLRDTFPVGATGPFNYSHFWRTSLYRALLARNLAREMKNCEPEEAFLNGLILEIGLLILIDIWNHQHQMLPSTEEIDLLDAPTQQIIAWERRALGTDHRQLAITALHNWNFPETFIDCQRIGPLSSEQTGNPALVKAVRMAGLVTEGLFLDDRNMETILTKAGQQTGLSGQSLNEVIAVAFEQIEEISRSLRLKVDAHQDILQVMEKANDALGKLSEKIERLSRIQSGDATALPSFSALSDINEEKTTIHITLQAVAHEIRNPLVSIGGFAKRLATTIDSSSEVGKYIRVILEESNRLERVLKEMTEENLLDSD